VNRFQKRAAAIFLFSLRHKKLAMSVQAGQGGFPLGCLDATNRYGTLACAERRQHHFLTYEGVKMSICTCTPHQPACEYGAWLMTAIATGCHFIESPAFLTLSLSERDAFWMDYHQTVHEYLMHCGYVLEGEGQDASTH
jgi:hypothetical protein